MKLTLFEKDICTKYISGLSTITIAKEYDATPRAIGYLLRRNDIERRSLSQATRRYQVDECFFDDINTEAKAYILGLVYADGCNYRNEITKTYRLSIDLHLNDVQLLEDVKKCMQYDGPVRNGKQNMVTLRISNKHISDTLCTKGVVPAKSLILCFPTENIVPPELLRHFIRGYFDGDGGIWKHSKTFYNIGIVGTNIFCISVQKYITDVLYISSTIRLTNPNRNQITSTLKINKTQNVIALCAHIYDDATIYMQRKYDRYKMVISVQKAKKVSRSKTAT